MARPIRWAVLSRSRKPWDVRLVTSRCTVDVGIPVASRMSPRVRTGLAKEKASRMAVIFPSTSRGLFVDFAEESAAGIALTLDGAPRAVQLAVAAQLLHVATVLLGR